MPKLLLSTSNQGKLIELKALFSLPGLDILAAGEIGLRLEVEENGSTYLENAQKKALAYSAESGFWTLGDDTGLEVEALGGAPGLLSARAGSNDEDRRRRLLEDLQAHPRPWPARFRCALALAGPDGSLDGSEGEVTGEIIPRARGNHGFGYDPIFLVEGTGRTMAELDLPTKNAVSHRARAAQALIPALRARLRLEESA